MLMRQITSRSNVAGLKILFSANISVFNNNNFFTIFSVLPKHPHTPSTFNTLIMAVKTK